MEMLEAAGGPERAEAWLRQALARKERIMGFGHRVYKAGDVRAGILKHFARKAAEAAGMLHWEETAEIIERILGEEKNLFPNLDWPAARLYHALGLEIPLYTPIFVMAAGDRLVGALHRAAREQPAHPAALALHRTGREEGRPPGPAAVTTGEQRK